jgi:hypothetical protein
MLYHLLVERAVKWPDKVPSLTTCGNRDYDSTTYHSGWKYWDEHSRVIRSSADLSVILAAKKDMEERGNRRPTRSHGLFTVPADFDPRLMNRPYRLLIVIEADDDEMA